MNPLTFNGERYLVAPRGVTQWVCNVRAYLSKFRFEIGAFFQGVSPDVPDEDFQRIAPRYPVFRILR